MAGSGHDLSANPSDSKYHYLTYEICVFCHTPHNANKSMRNDTFWQSSGGFQNATATGNPTLLWNRQVVGVATTYSLYTSSTMNASTTQVRAYSLMCLSCHDGVSAINVLMQNPKDMGDFDADNRPDPDSPPSYPDQIGDINNVGINIGNRNPSADSGITDLANDHPISFDYTTAQAADAGLRAATGDYVGDPKVKLYPRPSDQSKVSMECSTCHDVHNQGDKAAGTFPFLVVTNNNSNLCFQCHLK